MPKISTKLNYLIIGIHGVGQINLAHILLDQGHRVQGLDVTKAQNSLTAVALKKLPIEVTYLDDFSLYILNKDINCVIYSSHQGIKNPVVKAAEIAGIPTFSQAHFLSLLIKQKPSCIAICGTNGKTSLTALLAQFHHYLELRPSYYVGSSNIDTLPSAKWDSGSDFIFEADEYAIDPPYNKNSKLSLYHPTNIICTNLNFDHPDIFESLEEIQAVFYRFFSSSKTSNPNLTLNSDSEYLLSLKSKLPKVTYFGFHAQSDLRILHFTQNTQGSHITFCYQKNTYSVQSPFWGLGNVYNICACLLYLLQKGENLEKIIPIIPQLHLPKRRMEKIAQSNQGGLLIDDYAHHPDSIKNLVTSIRSIFPEKTIHLVFEPHTFSRTKTLQPEFIQAFLLSDYCYLLPIYPSRESAGDYPSFQNEFDKEINQYYPQLISVTSQNIVKKINQNFHKEDIILVTGAGNLISLLEDIKSHFFPHE